MGFGDIARIESRADLEIRLSERDAALTVLREEIRESKAHNMVSAAQHASLPTTGSAKLSNHLSTIEALDLGVMELRASRAEAERNHMEVQLTAGLKELDDMRSALEQAQEETDAQKRGVEKQKSRVRAVARVAVKKRKLQKQEVDRLRDQIAGLRASWTVSLLMFFYILEFVVITHLANH